MAYLTCPRCGITLFDRNPLVAPRPCPRCAARGDGEVELKRLPPLRGGAAASLLGGPLPGSRPSKRRPDAPSGETP